MIDRWFFSLCNAYNHDPDEKEDIAGQQDKDRNIVDDVVNLLDLGEEGTLVYLVHVHHLPLLWVRVRRGETLSCCEARAVGLTPQHCPYANVQQRSSWNWDDVSKSSVLLIKAFIRGSCTTVILNISNIKIFCKVPGWLKASLLSMSKSLNNKWHSIEINGPYPKSFNITWLKTEDLICILQRQEDLYSFSPCPFVQYIAKTDKIHLPTPSNDGEVFVSDGCQW